MIELHLTRGDNQEGVRLRFPTTPAEIGEAFALLDTVSRYAGDVRILDVKSPVANIGQYVRYADLNSREDMQKLNTLAERIGGMSKRQRDIFAGALDAESVNGLDDVLRVSESLEEYTIIPNVSSDTDLGKYVAAAGLLHGDPRFPEKAWPYLDFAKIGAEYYADRGGAYTYSGYVLRKQSAEPEQKEDSVIRLQLETTGTVCVLHPSQIRTVIRAFRDNLFTQLFPHRREVPKTLIFAKTDSHADDIIQIVREEFGEGNEFCQKITCQAERPETVLSAFRNDYNPRIAVTVDMIATGTDVKPIECLIFMRDVRSKNYFEQMKGRGTRTLGKDDLQKVTPSATENKDHFVIVDAVGVTKSKKTETRALERKPSVSMKELMLRVAMGAKDEDTLTSLANRVIRLNSQMTDRERTEFSSTIGSSAGNLAQRLLDAFDPDVISARAGVDLSDDHEPTGDERQRMDEAKENLIKQAVQPFFNPDIRDYIENVRRSHEQVIDSVNIDSVLFAGYDTDKQANADRILKTFHAFIEENKDEILALRIIYDQRYKDRPMAITRLKALHEKLKAQNITIERLWECYAIKKPEKVKRGTVAQLTDLISIIRFEMGYADNLAPFADKVNYNFMQWTLRRNAGAVHFTDEQMEWLRLIKDHIAVSLSIEPEDLDLSPFDRKGGLGRFYDVFGDQYEVILQEMNVELVA